jgi:heme oxygenase (biliverdin-IX-beta and delta-forming)
LNFDAALTELRLTTRAEHDRIERVLSLAEPMTMARYAAIMSGFDAFLRVWEPRVQDALPARLQPWFRVRRRGGLASADVAWLRDEAGEAPPAMSAKAAATLPLDHLVQLLGSIYVIEGSALGGRLIAPHLRKTLGVGPGHGASYFHGFGGQAGQMWRDYRVLASLEIGESSNAMARACRSAKRTFGALIDLFEPLSPLASLPPLTGIDLDMDLDDDAEFAAPAAAEQPDAKSEDDTIVDLR